MSKKNALLIETFLGQFVELTGSSGDDRVGLKGVLIDLDDEFLYLGSDNENITTAIKRSCVDLIGLEGQIDELHELLGDMKGPKSSEEIN